MGYTVRMDITDQKKQARTAGYARRKAAHADGVAATLVATQHLLGYITPFAPQVIAAYMPIRTEIDVLPAMHTLHGLGHRIAVPVIVGNGLPLSFKEWTPQSEMINGPFGAAIPANGDWLMPDLLITPLIAYNVDGYRLGYGGGFYDRSLELLRAKRPTIAVGFGYAGQEGEVPVEETDQRLDAMVTEDGEVRFKEGK